MTETFRERRRGEVAWLSLDSLDRCGLRHGFTLRRGGASRGRFRSLNFTTRQGDLPAPVRENWRRLEAAAGIAPESWALASQVHGAAVVPAPAGRSPCLHRRACPEADGIVAAKAGVTLGILTADCLPVLLCAPGGAGSAAVHAGWKGTLEGVVPEAVRSLGEASGAEPRELRAALGPCIGRCCYQVGEEVHRLFHRRWGPAFAAKAFTPADPWRLDLQAAARAQLIESGMRAERVAAIELCTSCRRDLFFSHRRDGERTGRMLAFAALRDGAGAGGRGEAGAGRERRGAVRKARPR